MSRNPVFTLSAIALALWLAFFIHACGAGRPLKDRAGAGDGNAAPLVQVGLGRCLRDPQVRIAVHGPYEVRGRKEVLARGGTLPWVEVTAGETLSIGSSTFSENPVTLVPEEDGSIEIEYSRDSRGNPVKPAGVRYKGTLIIHVLPDRKLALVNEVDLEEYLKGVVGKEMHLAEGDEALKSQVIVARSYAVHEQRLERLRRVKGEKFDLYDDERSQMYGGLERQTAAAEKLVDDTRGMFVLFEGKIVRTFYSSACGGHTEPAWEIMTDETEKVAPLAGTKCDYCQRRALYRWKEPVIIPKKEIAEKCLPKELQDKRIKTVDVTKTLPGGHALEVSITLENSSRVVRLNANNDFKRAISEKLRSTLWDRIEDKGDAISIIGRGYGHGAGLCQIGAYEMAKDGRTVAEILEYYYPGAKVQKVY
ncbi:MAG TPA: SpoIID/LytB domain-containing protein [Planctomycetota bacterium]|nr:SpoIID/LytB domain-containing protein [Planctomycetota bacterium]